MSKVALTDAKQTHWAKTVADWCHSGQSQRAFCQKRGMPLSTFQWWRRRLKVVAAEPETVSFLPIPMQGSTGEAGLAVVDIELRSGTRLRFAGEAALRAVEHLVYRVR